MPNTLLRLCIYGKVQGVSFRDWTCAQAEQLHISGWVRNRQDGSVEALASGATEAVSQFVTRCARGPAAARVERVEQQPAKDFCYPDGSPIPSGLFTRIATA